MSIVNLNEILKNAQDNHYGIGMFDVINLEMVNAVIDAAIEKNSPVILALAEVHIPTQKKLYEIANIMVHAAKKAPVPVAVHLDHATKIDNIKDVLEAGFSSVMYDGSVLPVEENIKNTQEIVTLAKKYGASVEAELGHVGGAEAGIGESNDRIYTDPLIAKDFVNRTGIDALAVSIGTAHGFYKSTPKLNINLLKEISDIVDIPLVLHGGSGLSDEDFTDCIKNGISKINIYTEIVACAVLSIKNNIKANQDLTYPMIMDISQNDMKETVKKRIELFGSSEKIN